MLKSFENTRNGKYITILMNSNKLFYDTIYKLCLIELEKAFIEMYIKVLFIIVYAFILESYNCLK